MKKIIIASAATSVLFFTGCFIDSDTATVRINLGNIPVAKVEKKSLIDRFLMVFAKEAVAQVPSEIIAVHLGAFDSNNQLLAKKSINVSAEEYPENNIVSFDVPARSGVTIVVLGEEDLMPTANIQQISYYGKNDVPLNLTAGTTITEEIVVLTLYEMGIGLQSEVLPITWDSVIGASSYDIYNMEDVLIQSNLNNFYNSWEATYMYIIFDFAESKSDKIYMAF